jgi:hypothetical protein
MRLLSAALLLALGQALTAQQAVVLHINHRLGDAPFVLNQASEHDGYAFNVKRLQYYLSRIEIVHDGGQVTLVPDTWLLVDASKNVTFELGSYAVSEIEGMRFSVGVEEAANHLDPASYPSGHPLAYQVPSMHWGWVSGYRFVCMEGYAGELLNTLWEVHALGNENYHRTELSGSAVDEGDRLIYYVDADYRRGLEGLDLSLGLLEHGTSGYAVTLLDNFAELVFSRAEGPMVVSGMSAVAQAAAWELAPNPAPGGRATVTWAPAPQGSAGYPASAQAGSLMVWDALGRAVQQHELAPGQTRLDLELPAEGLYWVQPLFGGDAQPARPLIALP